jgi:hypothetical protein
VQIEGIEPAALLAGAPRRVVFSATVKAGIQEKPDLITCPFFEPVS